MTLSIHTDGSYRAKTKLGAWGFIATYDDNEFTQVGEVADTTNNVMEIQAVKAALEFIIDFDIEDQFEEIIIYCDSTYVVNSLTLWWDGWVKKNFRTASGPVKNKELLESTKELLDKTNKVKLQWVKGHADNRLNNKVDRLVQEATKKKTSD